MIKNTKFYLIDEVVLSDTIKKTLLVKELIRSGEVKTVNEAVEKVDLSRSAYYKYKDHVFAFSEASKEKIVSLSITLEDTPGMLSKLLKIIAKESGNILTINQSIPSNGLANINITIETKDLAIELEALLDKLRIVQGIKTIDVLGHI